MSSSVLPPFKNASKQIRLLKRVARDTDLLDFAVTVWDLVALPAYHAISYTWGSPSETASIYVNGRPQTVRHNCYYSLWQVGINFKDHYIWIDSLCIDQSSLEEKNKQVPMMGQIYLGAEAVLACIGPHADGSEVLLNRHLTEKPDDFEGNIDLLLRDTLLAFFGRPYWTRVWILQEINLARQIYILCGEDTLVLKDFARYPWRSDWKDDLSGMPGTVKQIILGSWKRDSLWSAVSNYTGREFRCENPRDHVYGMLALVAPDVGRSPIRVDYSITMPNLMLEVIKRHRYSIGLDFCLSLQHMLRAFRLISDTGLPSLGLQAWRSSIAQQPAVRDALDDYALAACWHSWPFKREIPDVLEHLPLSCKAATFSADLDGRLVVIPFESTHDLLPPPLRSDETQNKHFIPCSEDIAKVTFESMIDNVVCTIVAHVTSTARPGDLLLRPGHHVFAHPHRVQVGQTMRQDIQWLPMAHLSHLSESSARTELAGITSEYLAVIRWLGPGLWKVIGQGHITSCTPKSDPAALPLNSICFRHTRYNYEVMYSLTCPEASLLLWTHSNILWNTPEQHRMAKIDEIISVPPPSTYYYIPALDSHYMDQDLEDCRTHVEPEWEEKYCSGEILPDANPSHLWFHKQSRDYEWLMKRVWPGENFREDLDVFRSQRHKDLDWYHDADGKALPSLPGV